MSPTDKARVAELLALDALSPGQSAELAILMTRMQPGDAFEILAVEDL